MRPSRSALIFLALVASATFLYRPDLFGWKPTPSLASHRETRQRVIYLTLNATENQPIVVLGDSIVEASSLPRELCGHSIINAGLSGASSASDLGDWLAAAMTGKTAAMIIVGIGTNDALLALEKSAGDFQTGYGKLLDRIATLAPRLAVLSVPAMEAKDRISPAMQAEAMISINRYNAALPGLAERVKATFVPLPAATGPHTLDGVHLNAAGYASWHKTVLQTAAAACGIN